jgi:hypothetical protein
MWTERRAHSPCGRGHEVVRVGDLHRGRRVGRPRGADRADRLGAGIFTRAAVARRGQPRDAKVLPGARPGRIAQQHTDAEGSRGQLALQQPEDAVLLGGSGFPLPGGVGEAPQQRRRPPVGRETDEYLDPGARVRKLRFDQWI